LGNDGAVESVLGDRIAVSDRQVQWAEQMRAANRGDDAAYRRVLEALTPVLRGWVRRGLVRYGSAQEEVEDVVQETLLALHLKRHTWDEARPLLPWVMAVAHNKLIDALRRRGRHLHVPIEDVGDLLSVDHEPAALDSLESERALALLGGRARDIVQAISVEGASAREVARRLGMTEGAVRVALHRALKSLASALRN
jgi:RNA polymerase sigma-70 factor (ECF subfamily)